MRGERAGKRNGMPVGEEVRGWKEGEWEGGWEETKGMGYTGRKHWVGHTVGSRFETWIYICTNHI